MEFLIKSKKFHSTGLLVYKVFYSLVYWIPTKSIYIARSAFTYNGSGQDWEHFVGKENRIDLDQKELL
ncbi:hypothetical protein BpHYR1_046021 [Brachionus plicatilis]|uniref:Uncharacterized protein n=1 Tax=Brachionus plicatilis TaxID=10195 RepID=A0A3M7QWT3_BRAPC|nr:hypothetical protein BpHYR1_046021 [Brachionus plicatilis]